MNASCALQHFCEAHGPQILLCTEARTYVRGANDNDEEDLKTFYSQYIKSENPQSKGECKSCTLSPEGTLVSTIDSVNQMLYISSSSTPNQELFKNTRNACVRSLTIEKSAEVDAPILFGDAENGYCLSLAFSCKDFHARGTQRLYSLCYLCSDKYHLLSLMKLLSECLRQAAHWLQYDANQIYEQEGRIKVNTNLHGSSEVTTYVFRPPPRVPSQRMLSDIVHDLKITHRIHALFVWLLRTASLTIRESLFDALPTEDETTKHERKEAHDDDELTESLSKRRTTTITSRSVLAYTQESYGISATLTNHTLHPSYLSTSMYSAADRSNRHENGLFDDDDDDFDSLLYQFSAYGYEAFSLFRLFVKRLNNTKHLQHILHNWVIGNRIILKYVNRTEQNELIRALASVFRLFVPDGCFHLIEATSQTTSCTANLILCDLDVISDSDVATLADESNEPNSVVIKLILDDIDENIRVAKLETLPPAKSEVPVPTYVKTLTDLLADGSLNEEAFESIVTQHKIKYLNKAKLYFQLGRCATASTLSANDRQQMTILSVENTSDLKVIRFWQKGLSQAYRKQIRVLKQDHNQQQRQ